MNVAIDNVLDEMAKFSLQDKEVIMGILEKRIIDEKRRFIVYEHKKAMKDYKAGRVKIGSVDQLFDSVR